MSRSFFFISLLLIFSTVAAQTTTGSINGIVKTNMGDALNGATIKMIHELTGTTYFSQTGKTGHFFIPNLSPGGPYRIEASFVNFDTEKKNDITVGLGENITVDLSLSPHSSVLQQITVTTVKRQDNFWRKHRHGNRLIISLRTYPRQAEIFTSTCVPFHRQNWWRGMKEPFRLQDRITVTMLFI
jgi:hypothetical protein